MTVRPVKSADRTLEVFELFSKERRPLSMKEISASLGYPTSSTMYLLKALSSSGYLNYNKRFRNYFPTSRIRTIGAWIEGHLPDNTEVMDVMKHLRLRFGETVAIGIQNDLNLQYLKAFESDYPIRYHIREGGQRPLLEAAMGWMIMSRLSDHVVEGICLRSNQLLHRQAYDFEAMRVRLSKVREVGYCYIDDQSEPYFASTVAMHLPVQYNGQDMVIGLGGEKARIATQEKNIIAEMQDAIADLHH
ncbi:IclR family transcriptional regulator [Mesorhizobium australicum]|uniref:IclR family transcriptional regulator n=1 Tax=Mesorhizobium australicum TaxID=536018 RepID=UPI00333536B1